MQTPCCTVSLTLFFFLYLFSRFFFFFPSYFFCFCFVFFHLLDEIICSNHKMEDPWWLMVCVCEGFGGLFGTLVAVLCGGNGRLNNVFPTLCVLLWCWSGPSLQWCVCVCVFVIGSVNTAIMLWSCFQPTLWLACAPVSSVKTICDWLLFSVNRWTNWQSISLTTDTISTAYGILSNLERCILDRESQYLH